MVGMAQGCTAKLVRRRPVQPFAPHLIAPGFKTPAIAKAHFLTRGTASIGLMRLAEKASRTRGFRACGSWLLTARLGSCGQAEDQPRFACCGLLWTDTMHDCLRRFSRKVIAGLAQAFANVVGKPAICAPLLSAF
jgi:hypothetical protein